MDAVEFYKQFARYCSSSYCCACTIVESCKTKSKDGRDAEKIVRTIEQWAKDNPVKTRQSEFLKMFPNAKLDINGVLVIRPCDIDSKYCTDDDYLRKCGACARDYWLAEVTP